MEYQKFEDSYIIRVARGEKIIESLTKLAEEEKILGGFFTGIGAADMIEIAHYSVDNKKYSSKIFNEALEITNITGNISNFENNPVIHCHGTFSDKNMNCFGGHIVEARVSGTLELVLNMVDKLSKKIDPETGLKILDLL